jgi:lysozyme
VFGALGIVVLGGCGPRDALGELEQGLMVCPTQTVEGVDVYQGDGTVNWTQVASSGRGFAIAKATQGDYNSQADFAANWAGIRAAGLLRAPYHYFDATISGVAQAQYFLSAVADAGGFEPGDLPAMLDVECPTSSMHTMTSGLCLGTGVDGWAPPATVAQEVFDWLHTVETATGKRPVLYSYVSWFADVGVTDSALANYPLWIASIDNSCATIPAPWTAATFWQYSVSMHVPGIGGAATSADTDRFIGDPSQLIAFAATTFDAGSADAGAPDAGGTDQDAGIADAGRSDSGVPDAGAPGQSDAGMTEMNPGGCGCGSAGAAPWLLLAGLGAARSRRRRAA